MLELISLEMWGLTLLLGFGVVLAMESPNLAPGTTLIGAATTTTLGAVLAVNFHRKRKGSTKESDARTGPRQRYVELAYAPLRVLVNDNGKTLEKFEQPPDSAKTRFRSKGGVVVISAFHHYAYFNLDQSSKFNADQRAAMAATAAVEERMTINTKATLLGQQSGVSYWSRITNWAKFENFCLT